MVRFRCAVPGAFSLHFIAFSLQFCFFLCVWMWKTNNEKRKTKNEKRTVGYFGCLFKCIFLSAAACCVYIVSIICVGCLFLAFIFFSLGACLLDEVPITPHATVSSTDVLRDVFVHGNLFASPRTWFALVVFRVVLKMAWFSIFRVLSGNVILQRILWTQALRAMRTREPHFLMFFVHMYC